MDDEEQLRTYMCEALTNAGYRVIQAANGKEALAVLLSRHVNLLITDLIMPEQEGIETILYVRKNFPNLTVIAMSGGDVELLRVARKLGARAVLCKPFSIGELVATVNYVCWPAASSGSEIPDAEEDSPWPG